MPEEVWSVGPEPVYFLATCAVVASTEIQQTHVARVVGMSTLQVGATKAGHTSSENPH